MGRLFGTDGVRGVWGESLTPELLLRLSRAIGAYFGPGSRVLVGRDTRRGGDLAVGVVSAGLMYEGVKVYYAGITPTPSLQLYVRDHGFDGGVMVTASHNPPEYNGVKVVGPDGVEISREDEERIEELYFKGEFGGPEVRGLLSSPVRVEGVNDYYVEKVAERVDSEKIAKVKPRVVIDCGNGATSFTSPYIARKLGAKPLTLNCNPDPQFPSRHPEPTPESLRDSAAVVRAIGAHLGVGHDADGDRAIVIDSRGEVHWGDRSGSLLARFAYENKLVNAPGRVYTGVSSSMLVEEYLKPAGIEVVWTPVGAVTISRRMMNEPGVAGFEENGGYIHPAHQYVRDGGMTMALMLYMLVTEGLDSSRLFSKLPKYYAVKTKVPVSTRSEVQCFVEEAKSMFSGERLILIDGVKAVGEDYWVLVRPSGTEPVVRIMVEARSPERARELAESVAKSLSERCKKQ
ncbi:MAG: phosphoglucosamine mutase [Desulfurococcales archaeon]|nr:phosphoglucosamine mutase [Desulfurococcales archaeon]